MTISYSISWEDYANVIRALDVKKRDKILCIASGGENLFALALENPKEIIGIDISFDQLALIKLKIAAIKSLSYEKFTQFIGLKKSEDRIQLYNVCSQFLDQKSRKYWNGKTKFIKNGIIHSGKFEKYLKHFRNTFLKINISKSKLDRYLSLTTLQQQKKFYDNYWNNLFWKTSFRIFFSKTLMQALGRNKEYFKYNSKESLSKHYFNKAEYGITKIPVTNNPFIHYILKGEINIPISDHPYLDKKNFLKLKKKVDRIKVVQCDIKKYLEHSKKKFSKFCLSDIFESMSQKEYEEILKLVLKNSTSNSRICYWNNLAIRNGHTKIEKLKLLPISKTLMKKDRVFFYSDFLVEKII